MTFSRLLFLDRNRIMSVFNNVQHYSIRSKPINISFRSCFMYILLNFKFLMKNLNIEDLYHQQSDPLISALSHDLDH